MDVDLKHFKKNKDWLVCIDSDGCTMDTMDIKHIRCFGPCMVEEWGLSEWKMPILERWNDINLFAVTRGINRFKGLAKILREVHISYCPISGLETLENWVEESTELSEPALERAIAEKGSQCLKKALAWSKKVNMCIDALLQADKKAFAGVKEALAHAKKDADIAVVSSANLQAVKEEWQQNGLLESVNLLLAQDTGSKAYCIQELLQKGYDRSHVLMVGDAMGDYEAAKKNGVFFYPVLVRHEKESWEEFQTVALQKLLQGSYQGEYQKKKLSEFMDNFQK